MTMALTAMSRNIRTIPSMKMIRMMMTNIDPTSLYSKVKMISNCVDYLVHGKI